MTSQKTKPWRALPRLSEAQAAYVAGLIDGEGCISAKANSSSKVLYPFVTIQMSTAEPLSTIGDWLGTPPYIRADRGYHRIDWHGMRAVQLLQQVKPYLLLKGDQAALALELDALAIGRGTGQCPAQRRVYRTPPETIERMREIKAKLSALKKAS